MSGKEKNGEGEREGGDEDRGREGKKKIEGGREN